MDMANNISAYRFSFSSNKETGINNYCLNNNYIGICNKNQNTYINFNKTVGIRFAENIDTQSINRVRDTVLCLSTQACKQFCSVLVNNDTKYFYQVKEISQKYEPSKDLQDRLARTLSLCKRSDYFVEGKSGKKDITISKNRTDQKASISISVPESKHLGCQFETKLSKEEAEKLREHYLSLTDEEAKKFATSTSEHSVKEILRKN